MVNRVMVGIDEKLAECGFWDAGRGITHRYNSCGESIESCIEDYLNHLVFVEKVSVIEEQLYESPGYDTGFVSVVFVLNTGELGHTFYQWEMC